MADEEVEYFDTTQFSEMMEVAVGTVRRWIRDGQVVASKGPNGRHRIAKADAVAFANKKWGDQRL